MATTRRFGAAAPDDLSKVQPSVLLVAGTQDASGNYGIRALAAHVKGLALDAEPPTCSPVLLAIVQDLSDAGWWASDAARTNALLPRDGSGNALASGLAVRVWDSFEDLAKERQRARAALYRVVTDLLPDACDAWRAQFPSETLQSLATQLRDLPIAQVTVAEMGIARLRVLSEFLSLAARAASGELSAIPHFAAIMRNATKTMEVVGPLCASALIEIRATRPSGWSSTQTTPQIAAARVAARTRLIAAANALLDL
jgi:hypothetical protein